MRPISRPDANQRIVYNGHKRVHALKFKSVVINPKWINWLSIWSCW